MEQADFIQGHSARLFGIFHDTEGIPPRQAFVFSHPFGEEKLWSHRVFVSFARSLATLGYPSLRFDYMGCGDSLGNLEDSSLDSHIQDLRSAVSHLRDRIGDACPIGLIGLRLGASVAAMLAERADIESGVTGPLVLWDPIVDGHAYMQELLRSHLSTQLAVYGRVIEGRDSLRARLSAGESVNIDGYEIADALFNSCSFRNPLPDGISRFAGRSLVVQISPQAGGKHRPDLESFTALYQRGTFASCTEDAFWKEIRPFYGRAASLERITLDWLAQTNA